MLARTFARIDNLSWDMSDKTVDIKITSIKKQDINLIARYGIEDISASSGVLDPGFKQGNNDCIIHLPEKTAVEIHLKLGNQKPIDWVSGVVMSS